MSTLTQAHNELFRRRPDECFSSVESLIQHCRNEHRESQDRWHLPARLQPTVVGGELSFAAGDDGEFLLNDWSFSQICRLSGVAKEIRVGSTLSLGVVRTRLAISDAFAAAQLLKPTWIMERDQYPNAPPDAPFHKRFILYEAYGHGNERVTCRPDASAWLRLPGDPPWNLILYLEYDRSTETHAQILVTKVPGYATLLHPTNRFYRQHWPDIVPLGRDFSRVAFVCQSEERIANLSNAMQGLPGAENVRFITDAELDHAELLTAPLWRTANGDRKAMIHPSPSLE